mgnify:FL=1
MEDKLKDKTIKLIVFDFDGVMTDNRVLINEDGKESVFVNRADGLGVEIIKRKNIPMLILSTEKNKVVNQRGKKLGIEVIQCVSNKKVTLEKICADRGILLENVMYVGNDENDFSAMSIAGIRACPADAHKLIKNIADLVLTTNGGYGVVRELADLL